MRDRAGRMRLSRWHDEQETGEFRTRDAGVRRVPSVVRCEGALWQPRCVLIVIMLVLGGCSSSTSVNESTDRGLEDPEQATLAFDSARVPTRATREAGTEHVAYVSEAGVGIIAMGERSADLVWPREEHETIGSLTWSPDGRSVAWNTSNTNPATGRPYGEARWSGLVIYDIEGRQITGIERGRAIFTERGEIVVQDSDPGPDGPRFISFDVLRDVFSEEIGDGEEIISALPEGLRFLPRVHFDGWPMVTGLAEGGGVPILNHLAPRREITPVLDLKNTSSEHFDTAWLQVSDGVNQEVGSSRAALVLDGWPLKENGPDSLEGVMIADLIERSAEWIGPALSETYNNEILSIEWTGSGQAVITRTEWPQCHVDRSGGAGESRVEDQSSCIHKLVPTVLRWGGQGWKQIDEGVVWYDVLSDGTEIMLRPADPLETTDYGALDRLEKIRGDLVTRDSDDDRVHVVATDVSEVAVSNPDRGSSH